MGLGLKERYAVIEEIAKRYQKSRKKEKGRILEEFLKLTGYNRKYGMHVIANWGKKRYIILGGKRVVLVAGKGKRKKYARVPTYEEEVRRAIEKIWIVYGCICGKRLKAVLDGQMAVLKRCRSFQFEEKVWELLEKVSVSTIDRLLGPERSKDRLKGRSYTKPGSLLKHNIPIRTAGDWNEKKPGFFEADLVGHDGGNASGDFAFSLNMTDVHTGWTEPVALKNKAQKWAFQGIMEVQSRLPMKILGFDSDNGSEFINAHLYNYCKTSNILFTRSRPNRKNDNCFVEQKNYSVIRRYVGYFRYDTDEEVELLNELYREVRLAINFFLPSMKLKEKIRVGSRIVKKYDIPKTPYQRLLESRILSDEEKNKLEEMFLGLNPVSIQRKILSLQEQLEKTVVRKQRGLEPLCEMKAL